MKEEDIKCEYTKDSFKVIIKVEGVLDIYELIISRTREKIVPEKCKHYIRKNEIFIALYKEVPFV